MFKRYVPAAAGILYAVPFCFRHRSHLCRGRPRHAGVREASTQCSCKEPYCDGRLLSAGQQVGDSQSRPERARIIRLSGAIRSQNSATGPVQVFRVGETFFEPPGSTHLIS
jgi:hypothetical protein